ncbi:MAG: hypothetical protein J6T41_04865, partial [Neisseriaceae bacterium]|nr:hypothetical protein [Neisseriaceae bacterium]
MKIQVITNNELNWTESQNLKFSSLSNLQSPDEFGINLIDLSSKDLWYNDKQTSGTINKIND